MNEGSPVTQKSLLSLKSWLFTPATKSDRFARAGDAHADVLIIDLEDSVAPSAKKEARETALRYLAAVSADHMPLALRVNSTDTMFGLDDLQALLSSSANPDYLVLPKCRSAALIELVGALLREAGKTAHIIALIESAKGIEALDEIAGADPKPAALLFGAADMAADLGAETAWEPLLWVRSRIVQASESAGIAALDSPYFDIADIEGLKRETKKAHPRSLGFHMANVQSTRHKSQSSMRSLTPSEQQPVAEARQILIVNRGGVGSIGHRMVDEAVARKARLVLERAGIPEN